MANDISKKKSSRPGQTGDKEQTTRPTKYQEKVKTREQPGHEPAMDKQRVAHVRAALQRGTYHVDPEKIAEKMIDLESDLDD